jgi:hypothetical protein
VSVWNIKNLALSEVGIALRRGGRLVRVTGTASLSGNTLTEELRVLARLAPDDVPVARGPDDPNNPLWFRDEAS